MKDMKAHIDCPCSLQPRPLSPQRASTQASWWVGIPCAVAKIDRHVCVCVCVHCVLHVGGSADTLCAMAPGTHTSTQ